jgi:putative polyhydroxyalkanoate system protein
MSHITIRRPHKLKGDALRKRVEHLADTLCAKYGADWRWSGDQLLIEHSNVNGAVTCDAKEIVIEAKLGFFLSMFRDRIDAEIERVLDEELGGKA